MKAASKRSLALVMVFTLAFSPVRAHAGTWTGGASEWTQISNNIQLIEHTINLIQMVVRMGKQLKWMAKQAEQLSSPQDFLNLMTSAGGMLSEMRGLLFASESLVKRWELTHQGGRDLHQYYSSPSEAYRTIDEGTRQAVLRTMKVLELQTSSKDGWPKDKEILKQLQENVKNADGQLKAIQAVGDLLAEVVRQLHLLRGVQIAHAEMMGYAVSGETQRRQFEERYVRDRFTGYSGKYRATHTVDLATDSLGYGKSAPMLGTPGANGVLAPVPGSTLGHTGTPGANGVLAPVPVNGGRAARSMSAHQTGAAAPSVGTTSSSSRAPAQNVSVNTSSRRERVLNPWTTSTSSEVVNPWN